MFVHNGTHFTHWKTSETVSTLSTTTTPTNSSQVSFGYTNTSPSSSIVTFNSLTKGVVLPRLTKAEIEKIKTPAEGLVIYCKDCTTKGLLVNNNSSFINGSETISTSSSATSLNNTPRYGIGTTTPNISALLEIKSTKQGVLFPRLNKTLMNTITKPVEGLIVYCTDCTPKGLYVYNGTTFVSTK